MSWRVIDISHDNRHLTADRQWLVIRDGDVVLGRIPLPDIQTIIIHARHATYSHGLLIKLGDHGIPLVICNSHHIPHAIMLACNNHHAAAGRIRTQAESKAPLRKRIWRDLIKAKITEQARTLTDINPDGAKSLLSLAAKVRAGDPDNIEAQAARLYWRRLFGDTFKCNQNAEGINSHLNYGYAIIRSGLARAVVSSGLSPALGVGHSNKRNNFALVDDLIEPFRPLVDRIVHQYADDWNGPLTSEAKIQLAAIMETEIHIPDGNTDLFRVMTITVNSLVTAFEAGTGSITLPTKIEQC